MFVIAFFFLRSSFSPTCLIFPLWQNGGSVASQFCDAQNCVPLSQSLIAHLFLLRLLAIMSPTPTCYSKCQQLRTQLVRHSRACVSHSLKFFLFFIIIPHSLHYYIILFCNYDVMVFVPPPTPPPVASQFASVTDPLSWYSLLLTQL